MTERCWEELYRAGEEIAAGAHLYRPVKAVAVYFDLPRTREEEAAHVFLEALRDDLRDGDITGEPEAEDEDGQ